MMRGSIACLSMLLAAAAAHADIAPGVAAVPGVGNPLAPLTGTVATGGAPVTVYAAGVMAGRCSVADIQNPPGATESLFVDINAAASSSAATSFELGAGMSFRVSRPVATAISAVAATAGHPFHATCY